MLNNFTLPPSAVRLRQRLPLWALIGISGSLLTLILAAGGILFWRSTHGLPSIPSGTTEAVLFPIYLPAYLPPGFVIDQNSYVVKDNVLIFQATNSKHENLAVTEATLPPKFDFTDFYQKNFTGTKNLQSKTPYTTIIGTLKNNGRYVVSIETPTTWIIVTSHHSFNEAEAVQLAKGFRRH